MPATAAATHEADVPRPVRQAGNVLAAPREHPYDPERPVTVCYCLHGILKEEWEHLRYAVRDLDAIDAIEAERAG